ncbi:MAG: Curli production assembly/transport component CsgG [Bacteroidetes bacterium]|nr:MAG: Curli production assembly/transport component CsgG [Bacteroidota bacterium]
MSKSFAQKQDSLFTKSLKVSKFGNELRGKNALSLGVGTSVMNGDLANPMFEIYSHIGYKRFLGSAIAINFGYHKFNLGFEDVFNEGFMSFDLNLEWYITPHQTFTPFIFGGAGYHAANYFETNETKIQVGGGFEYLMTERIGLKFFADYNYMFNDEVEGLVFGESDDAYWRVAIGLNIYFGKYLKPSKWANKIPTVINSNQLVDDY